MHQFIGTFGIGILAPWLVAASFDFLAFFGWRAPQKYTYLIVTENPYFPIQIGLGLFIGWRLSRRFRHRSMLWVWVLPFMALEYAFIRYPLGILLLGQSPSLIAIAGSGVRQALWHYFGWGCRPVDRCLDQLWFTMPLYTSIAYSVGAALGRAFPRKQAAAASPA
jgi:hypothetical protein